MVIKAWPYGRKPGIAVAKETNSHLLTVRPLKLWGAVAPVAPWRKKKQENQGRIETITVHVLCSVKSLHCAISGSEHGDFPSANVTVSLIHTGRGFDFAPTRTAKKTLLSINCLHRPQSPEYSTRH